MASGQDAPSMQVVPNRSVGSFNLGATLHEILSQIKSQPSVFPALEIYYSRDRPVADIITIVLPQNGIRARFDGVEQRLRLIEIVDFSRTKFLYKDIEIGKVAEEGSVTQPRSMGNRGPTFRHVYDKLLGPTYRGEYVAPTNTNNRNADGAYILSYPGIAFSFPVRHGAFSPDKDFIPLLSSSAASSATSFSVFAGEDWPTARVTLYTAPIVQTKGRDEYFEDVDMARILGSGKVMLDRRSGVPFEIVLGETTPQDLITELGPPDAIYWKKDHQMSIHKERTHSQTSDHSFGALHRNRGRSADSYDSEALETDDEDDSDWEDDALEATDRELPSSEHFYNYFSQGFDILISDSYRPSPAIPNAQCKDVSDNGLDDDALRSTILAASKIIFHGNVPGSYQFNRHRRCRWTLGHVPPGHYNDSLHSEMCFEDISGRLKDVFSSSYADEKERANMERGMAVNRGWGDSPGSSMELLGGLEEHSVSRRKPKSNQPGASVLDEPGSGVGRTTLYGFPGMVFEVLDNDAVCTLTIY